MTKKRNCRILMLGAFAGALVPACAFAQEAQIDQLQRQIDTLQRQLKTLQKQVTDSKKNIQPVAQPPAAEGAYAADIPKMPVKASPAPAIKMTWGGYLAAESVFRQHNTVSDMGTPMTSTPYPFSPQFDEREFRASARASRLSLLLEGQIDSWEKLSGYYEMDFLGAAITSNYNQTNSWAARLRHAYFTYDNTDWGLHLLAGQAWSLITQNTAGILPRKENLPINIEGNFFGGFNYTRNWQLRTVKDFGPMFALGLSFEAPATQVYGSTGAVANNGTLNGLVVNWANPGNTYLGSGAFPNNFNAEIAPDIIGKAAFDPGWGHYEILGLVRFFEDNVFACTVVNADGTCPLTAANVGTSGSHVTVGEGIGGNVLLPVIDKYLDLQGSVLYGKGIGRYGNNQLADVVVASDGTFSPITALQATVGAVGHPWPGMDIWAYAGFEREQPNLFGSAAGVTGFGNPFVLNTGCNIVTAASFSGAGPANCAAINQELWSASFGFWRTVYQGSYGRVRVGAEYEFIERRSFDTIPGNGGVVSANNNVFMTSFRYYPF
jgi:hypothetical protein